MTLLEYLEREELKPSRFAARIGVPPSTITRILRGERSPHLKTLQAICAATDGAVSVGDFIAAAAVHAHPPPAVDPGVDASASPPADGAPAAVVSSASCGDAAAASSSS